MESILESVKPEGNPIKAEVLINVFKEVIPQNHEEIHLSNGSSVFKFGHGKKLFIMAGVHGDETSGPIALVEYFSKHKELFNEPIEFIVCPLLNIKGWDDYTRECGEVDINRSFNENAPEFVKELMEVIKQEKPEFFLDMHEDEEEEIQNYMWVHKSKGAEMAEFIANENEMTKEYWEDNQSNWNASSTEEFARSVGVKHAATSEVYCEDNIKTRVEKEMKVIDSVIRFVLQN